jgi:hypothetical protein
MDSTKQTLQHIATVNLYIAQAIQQLLAQTATHDHSKLIPPEKHLFDEYTEQLKNITYGSHQYNQALQNIKPALDHHYAANRHHPEFFTDGVNQMTIIDLLEMLADWKAATLRHNNGDLSKSIDINSKRFNISPQLTTILHNTAQYLGWTT